MSRGSRTHLGAFEGPFLLFRVEGKPKAKPHFLGSLILLTQTHLPASSLMRKSCLNFCNCSLTAICTAGLPLLSAALAPLPSDETCETLTPAGKSARSRLHGIRDLARDVHRRREEFLLLSQSLQIHLGTPNLFSLGSYHGYKGLLKAFLAASTAPIAAYRLLHPFFWVFLQKMTTTQQRYARSSTHALVSNQDTLERGQILSDRSAQAQDAEQPACQI